MKITTSVKLDKDVREEAVKLADELGLSLSSIVNHSLKNIIAKKQIVFRVIPDFNKKAERKILKLRRDIKDNKNLSKVYKNSEDLFEALEI